MLCSVSQNESTNILVVEDDAPMREVLRRGLEEDGHAVTVAADGSTGLSLAETYPFDVLVLDVTLPGINVASADDFRKARR